MTIAPQDLLTADTFTSCASSRQLTMGLRLCGRQVPSGTVRPPTPDRSGGPPDPADPGGVVTVP